MSDTLPHLPYGFPCSDRGRATFQTCLKVLIAEANVRPHLVPQLMSVLSTVTNFPPAAEALQSLVVQNDLAPRPLSILADCFREIGLRMVPGEFIANKIESVLEASRQMFAWMFDDILKENASSKHKFVKIIFANKCAVGKSDRAQDPDTTRRG